MKRVLLLAGEESGVLYANRIAAKLREDFPAVEIRGYGDYGFEVSDLAVMGFWAVLKKIFYFLRVKRTMERAIDEWRPDVVCTIDYPGLNLKLAAAAKAKGIRAVHVVCPQVWAWKQGRIPKIEAALDRLCCFFPFEPALFRTGFAAFVGHPLVEDLRDLSAKEHKEGAEKTLAVLPGSRLGEIEKHMPVLLEVINDLCAPSASLGGKIRIVIPAANEKAYRAITSYVSRLKSSSCVVVTHGGAREALVGADAAVVASGTATLEAAMLNCPTVLVYRVGAVLAWLARRLIKGVKHVGLANVVAEKAGVECPTPELLQEDFTVEKVLAELRPLLMDPVANRQSRQKLADTMKLLNSNGDSIANIVNQFG